ENSAVEIHVLTPAEFRVKARTDFQQTAHAPAKRHLTSGGFGDTREDLEEGRFPCPVTPNHADDLARFDFQRDVFQRPEMVGSRMLRSWRSEPREKVEGRFDGVGHHIPQRVVTLPLPEAITLAQMLNANNDVTHDSYHVGNSGFYLLKVQHPANAQNDNDRCRGEQQGTRWLALPEQRPAKSLNYPGHGVQPIQSLPL